MKRSNGAHTDKSPVARADSEKPAVDSGAASALHRAGRDALLAPAPGAPADPVPAVIDRGPDADAGPELLPEYEAALAAPEPAPIPVEENAAPVGREALAALRRRDSPHAGIHRKNPQEDPARDPVEGSETDPDSDGAL